MYSFKAAMDYFSKDIGDTHTISLVDAPSSKAYPIALVTYMIINMTTSEEVSCEAMKAFVRIIKWALTDDEAIEIVDNFKMVHLSEKLVKFVTDNMLDVITCKGALVIDLIAEDEKPPFFTPLSISLIAIGAFAAALLVGLVGKHLR